MNCGVSFWADSETILDVCIQFIVSKEQWPKLIQKMSSV